MQALTAAVEQRLEAGKGVRRRLPGGGRLRIDRPQPMLIVHRRRSGTKDEATEKLFAHASSLLIVDHDADVTALAKVITRNAATAFGGLLILEVWAGAEPANGARPRFVVHGPKRSALIPLFTALQDELGRVRPAGRTAEVEVRRGSRPAPPGLEPILTDRAARARKCIRFGLEIPPVYLDPASGRAWPQVLRDLRRDLTLALRRWLFGFMRSWTSMRPEHFHVIGSHSIASVVWQVDRQLAAIADSFDFLLLVTPVNAAEAWHDFKASGREAAPVLQYRPLPAEPTLLKRALFSVPIEKIDDPALYQIFREKQDELDRQITLLIDINTPRFLHGSIQLFGGVEDELDRVARDMLERLPPGSREKPGGARLDARAFAKRARKEIASFRRQWSQVEAKVEVREDIHTGLMVSQGCLLIGAGTSIPGSRAEALIQHEVGTHVLTYWNARAQPFRQLYSGLAGYDPLQEGIAVLAEHLVGGLSRPRRRLLMGRVVAARSMIDGATFVDTFRELTETWGFPARSAFTITLRIHRGGGLTKDAVYVRGFGQLIDYLRAGGDLEPLLVGKIGVDHVPLIQELQAREILVRPPLRPSYLDAPGVAQRLERIRSGLTLFQMVRDKRRAPGLARGRQRAR